jgi:hypothetical protein
MCKKSVHKSNTMCKKSVYLGVLENHDAMLLRLLLLSRACSSSEVEDGSLLSLPSFAVPQPESVVFVPKLPQSG